MKSVFCAAIFILASTFAFAGTVTDTMGLSMPGQGDSASAWQSQVRSNFEILEKAHGIGTMPVSRFSTLNEAVSSTGTRTVTLLINAPIVVAANMTVPANIALQVIHPNLININAYILTISGPFSAGLYQVFAGTGEVKFRSGAIKEVYPEWWGAHGDGRADDHAALQSAINSGARVKLASRIYKLNSPLTFLEGTVLEGCGRNNSILLNNSGDYGIILVNSNNAGVGHLRVKANHSDGSDKGIKVAQSGALNSLNNVFYDLYLDGNTRPGAGRTSHVGMHFVGAAMGYANYFNVLDNVYFTNWNMALKADWNANAGYMANVTFDNVWTCIAGGMQEWSGRNIFWHASEGSGQDFSYFMNIDGPDASHLATYNSFDVTAEPGKLSKMYKLGTHTVSNLLSGIWQAEQRGVDYGQLNRFVDLLGGMVSLSSIQVNNTVSTKIDGNTIDVFGSGNEASSGSQQNKIRVWGGLSQTRRLEIYQAISGNSTIQAAGAGQLELRGVGNGSGIKIGDGKWNGEPLQLGAYYLWVDSSGRIRIKSSAPAFEMDGTIVGSQL